MASRTIRKVQNVALNPLIVGTLHYLLTKAPERIRLPLLRLLSSRLSEASIQRLIKTLHYLHITAIAIRINDRLNQWALNGWQWRPSKDNWVWSWEIAVVTGGCSGIGKEVVLGLVEKGVRVAVLDIQPLPHELERSAYLDYWTSHVYGY
jgi:all-trans-retinol dehydrogenase (NAD+)